MLWLIELLVIVLAVTAAVWLRFLHDPEGRMDFAASAPIRTFLVAIVTTVAMASFGLYQVHIRFNRMDFLLRLLLAFGFGGVTLLVLYYVIPQTYIGRGVLVIALALGILGISMVRLVSMELLGWDALKRRVLVLGAGNTADMINQRLRRTSDRRSFAIMGFVPVAAQPVVVAHDLLVQTQGRLLELARSMQVHEIVVGPDERRGGLPMDELLECAQAGVLVNDIGTFIEREIGSITLNIAEPSSLVFSGGFDHSLPARVSKRLFDLIAASVLLLVSWPVMILVALAVALESGFPIFYRQTRVGQGGQCFDLIKFRSMRVDAENDGVARWASKDDDRSTKVGRFIRSTRLDELPQLFNVLRGTMSFVGPRPERPQFVDMLSKEIRFYNVRHSVKPGLTGWAQLRYPYGASVRDAEEKLKFDLFYVKNRGLLFDLMILLQTVEVVLFRRGAR